MSARLAAALVLAFGAVAPAASAVRPSPAGADQPGATLLYQNFPNPFPGATSAVTCIWFDLRTPSEVSLQVYDLRGDLVRTIVPSAGLSGIVPAGRYGRATLAGSDEGSGCDPRLTWGGTSDAGRVVPAGVYLLRMRAGSTVALRKMVFRGR